MQQAGKAEAKTTERKAHTDCEHVEQLKRDCEHVELLPKGRVDVATTHEAGSPTGHLKPLIAERRAHLTPFVGGGERQAAASINKHGPQAAAHAKPL